MLAEIIPIKRLPRSLGDTFSYDVPVKLAKQIMPGQIVEIDFRGRIVPALVKSLGKLPAAQAAASASRPETSQQATRTRYQGARKNILRIISPVPLVTAPQMKLASWLADYYFTSLATATKLIAPDLPKTLANILSRPVEPAAKKVRKLKAVDPQLLWWQDQDDLSEKIVQLIEQALKKDQKILWLFPEKYQAEKQYSLSKLSAPPALKLRRTSVKNIRLSKSALTDEQICFWQNHTTKKKNLEQYLDILSGKVLLTIGTRSALFAPFDRLGLIILVDEANSLCKSESTPRYHTREVAMELARLHGAKLVLTSPAPSLEALQLIAENNHRGPSYAVSSGVAAGMREKTLDGSKLLLPQVVDLKQERANENYSSLSGRLKDAIEASLEAGQQVFLFLNRRGFSTSIICQSCGQGFTCSNCRLPFNYRPASNLLVCHHCRAKQELPPFCPRCSGGDLKSAGRGVQKLEQEIKKIFPQAKVIRLDSDAPDTKNLKHDSNTNLQASSNLPAQAASSAQADHPVALTNYGLLLTGYRLPVTDYDIIIGTEYALHRGRLDWETISVIGVVNADTALYRPDFRASERTYQLLIRLKSLNLSLKSFIVQTYNPDNHVIRALAQDQPELFYEPELKLRKILHYPPFRHVFKLIYRQADEKKAVGEAMHIYHRLRKYLLGRETNDNESTGERSGNQAIEILRPFPAYARRDGGKYKFHLIVRLAFEAPDELYKKIRELVPPDWVIDRDPETLL